MLTTGLIGDVIGVAKPAIISDWPFLTETFGDTALCYGNDVAGLTQVFADLDVATLDQQADALRALQPAFAWERSADATLELFETMLG